MATPQEQQQTRLRTFANIFKGYMGVMPLVTAALAPLVTVMNFIPVYESQRKSLAAITGLLGFLLLAWLFYVRRTIALGSIKRGFRWFFNLSPLLLILGSIACYVGYFRALDRSLDDVTGLHPTLKISVALSTWGQEQSIPASASLQLLYLGVFLCAESAFVMMALREYANEVRGISEYTWMFGKQDGSGIPIIDDPNRELMDGR